ncbi:MAG: hypothetical protein L0387_29440 [Acidobacteria bacterium]|nr:hypothetical protein [Acidobacteriota bacterium]
MSMLRHRGNSNDRAQALLLYSSRTVDDIIYRKELEHGEATDSGLTVIHTLTRSQPVVWSGYTRRVDRSMLGEALSQLEGTPHAFVCGPTPFVEAVADALVSLDIPPSRIKIERFGPSG